MDWWTLGFEATGPAHLLHSELQATAALVSQPLPAGVQASPDYSRSYAEWLGRTPKVTPAPEDRPSAGSAGPPSCSLCPASA